MPNQRNQSKTTRLDTVSAREENVDRIVREFADAYQSHDSSTQELLTEFLFLGGIAIAGSDGEVSVQEMTMLSRLISRRTTSLNANAHSMQSPQSTFDRLEKITSGEKGLAHVLSYQEHLSLVRDLAMIVVADGKVTQSELATLKRLAQMVRVAPKYVDDLFATLAAAGKSES